MDSYKQMKVLKYSIVIVCEEAVPARHLQGPGSELLHLE